MADFNSLPDELVCLIIERVLESDYKSYVALASTCHRLNTLSMRIEPPSFETPATAICTTFYDLKKYSQSPRDPQVKEQFQRYSTIRSRFLAFLDGKGQSFPEITCQDLDNYGNILPFFWLKIARLKYRRVHKICFQHCKLDDYRPLDYMSELVKNDSLSRDNYRSITTLEIRYNKLVELRCLDKILSLLERIKILKLKGIFGASLNENQLRKLMENRSRRIKLEELHIQTRVIDDSFIKYLATICPAKMFRFFGDSYEDVQAYLHANRCTLKEFIANQRVYKTAVEDDLLSGLKITMYDCSW